MRWPFTTYGTGTLLATAGPLAALTAWLAVAAPGVWWLAPLALFLFLLNFFRDPERAGSGGEAQLLSPADGVVADIVTVDDPDLGLPVTRIGVFLSVFDVHVNRAPCAGRVVGVSQRDGGFLDARDPRATDENRAATIVLERDDGLRLAVRQITGLIARRIICPAKVGDELGRGERYGMIRFGSRTELCVPEDALGDVAVSIGDRVRGGETILCSVTVAQAVPRKVEAGVA